MLTPNQNEDVNASKEGYWEQLRELPVVRELQAAFSCATGLPICFLPPSDSAELLVSRRMQSPFQVRGCMGECSGPICRDALVQAEKKAATNGDAVRFECPAGLLKIVLPVMIGGKHVASLLVGPFTLRKLNGAIFRRLVGRLENWNLQGQSDQLRSSWKFGAVLTPSECEAVTKLARMFVSYLSECGEQLLSEAKRPPQLLRMIEQMLAENPNAPLSLKQLSDRVDLSPCHFSKLFKEQAGITFNSYRTRLRIERAKRLLMDPRLKIGEVAFEVGFNSISHFNQAFRQHAGCSPSKYRSDVRAQN